MCPTNCRKIACISLVRSVFDFDLIIVWDQYFTCDIEKLERVQRQAVRIITCYYNSREEGRLETVVSDFNMMKFELCGNNFKDKV